MRSENPVKEPQGQVEQGEFPPKELWMGNWSDEVGYPDELNPPAQPIFVVEQLRLLECGHNCFIYNGAASGNIILHDFMLRPDAQTSDLWTTRAEMDRVLTKAGVCYEVFAFEDVGPIANLADPTQAMRPTGRGPNDDAHVHQKPGSPSSSDDFHLYGF